MKKFIYALFIAAALASCTKVNLDDVKEIEYSPSLIIPVGKAHANALQLLSFIPDSLADVEDETKTIYLSMDKHFIDLFIPDINRYAQSISNNIETKATDIPGIKALFDAVPGVETITLPAGDYTTTVEKKFLFYDHGKDNTSFISRGKFISAEYYVHAQSTGVDFGANNKVNIKYSFPSIKTDDKEVVIDIPITKNDIEVEQHLSDMEIEFTSEFQDYTSVNIEYTIHSDGTLQISRNTTINEEVYLHIIKHKKLWGHIWQEEPVYDGEDIVDIPLDFEGIDFKNIRMLFSRPEVNIKLYNNIGIPYSFNIEELTLSDNDGKSISANFDGSTKYSLPINSPEDRDDDPFATTEVTFDRNLGHLDRMFDIAPVKMTCKYNITTTDKDINNIHFFPQDPHFNADVRLVLPLEFNAGTHFVYNDTINDINLDTSLPEGMEFENITLWLDVENRFPIATKFSLTFLDESDEELYATDEIEVESAQVDEDGRVTNASRQQFTIETDQDFIEKILSTTDIVLTTKVEGRDAESKINFQSDNGLDINISAFAKVRVNLNLDEQE